MTYRILKCIVPIAGLLTVSTGATAGIFGTSFSNQDEAAVYQGQMGALAISFQPSNISCGDTRLKFQNLYNGQTLNVKHMPFLQLSGHVQKSITLKAVVPGQYKLVKAECSVGNRTYRFDDIANAYGVISVRPGEVVYPGTFSPQRSGKRVKSYGLLNEAHLKAPTVMKKYPSLAQRFVNRPATAPMSRTARPYGYYR